jgi:hypothetical protein
MPIAMTAQQPSLESKSGHAPHSNRPIAKPDQPAVADLTVAAIEAMPRDELIHVLCFAGLPVQQEADVAQWANICDQRDLRRLVHVARRSCRMRGY